MHVLQTLIINNKRSIRKEAASWFASKCEYASSPKDYSNQLTIHDSKVFESYKDASDFMDNNYINWDYHDHAIPFHDDRNLTPSKKAQDILSRISKNQEARDEYIQKNSVQNRKSKSVTCPCCESRLSLSYLRGQKCPLCGTDLRSNTVLSRIKKFDTDDKALRRALNEENKKASKKAPIKWLVKVEAHS